MDKKTALRIAIKEMGRSAHPDDIHRRLCADGTLAWDHAEEIMEEARRKHGAAIALRKQSTMFLVLAFLGFLAGVYLIIINGLLLQDWGLPTPFINQIQDFDFPVYGVAYGANNVGQFLIGVALAGGSIFLFLWGLLLKT